MLTLTYTLWLKAEACSESDHAKSCFEASHETTIGDLDGYARFHGWDDFGDWLRNCVDDPQERDVYLTAYRTGNASCLESLPGKDLKSFLAGKYAGQALRGWCMAMEGGSPDFGITV